ncbi:hypothetical protein [Nannocystis pusilla]|nr:hypothetical protein [Nannocystis pusilla]
MVRSGSALVLAFTPVGRKAGPGDEGTGTDAASTAQDLPVCM